MKSLHLLLFFLSCAFLGLPFATVAQTKTPGHFTQLTPELAKIYGKEADLAMDPGHTKWLILFNEVAGEPPYTLQVTRIKPPKSILDKKLDTESISKPKQAKVPLAFVISARGFLPGEEVTFRISSNNTKIFRDVKLCPRPLVLTKENGEILAEAKLDFTNAEMTNYQIHISGVGKTERYAIRSRSGPERIPAQFVTGPQMIGFSPDVVGMKGGICNLEIHLRDQSVHRMELPWGTELQRYAKD